MASTMGIPVANAVVPISAAVAAETRAYLEAAVAANTRRAHRSHWADFRAWCDSHGCSALPASAETVAAYLTVQAQSRRVGTLEHRLATIAKAHHAAGLPNPAASELVRLQMRGIRRIRGIAPMQKTPTLVADLRAMVATLPDSLLGVRDRALLLVGFAGAFRRAELVALDFADLAFSAEGVTITVRRSKTDQERVGMQKAIHYGRVPATCPVTALRVWLEMADITEGPIFRPINRHGQLGATRLSDKAVALVVKRTAATTGLDPAQYAGHSLRAGLVTQAAANGEEERNIMRQTGHKSLLMVRRYIRAGSLFRDNITDRIGL